MDMKQMLTHRRGIGAVLVREQLRVLHLRGLIEDFIQRYLVISGGQTVRDR